RRAPTPAGGGTHPVRILTSRSCRGNTPLGVKAFRAAAPGHLRAVAERFGASLPASEMDRLTRDLMKIAARNKERSREAV
ncbi:MAG: hypothetical protein ACKO8K_04155, partial [Candidatus Limnocylindrus sp.]